MNEFDVDCCESTFEGIDFDDCFRRLKRLVFSLLEQTNEVMNEESNPVSKIALGISNVNHFITHFDIRWYFRKVEVVGRIFKSCT